MRKNTIVYSVFISCIVNTYSNIFQRVLQQSDRSIVRRMFLISFFMCGYNNCFFPQIWKNISYYRGIHYNCDVWRNYFIGFFLIFTCYFVDAIRDFQFFIILITMGISVGWGLNSCFGAYLLCFVCQWFVHFPNLFQLHF